MKLKFTAFAALLFVPLISFAESISIEPMQKVNVQVSTVEPNVIAVNNDKITSVTSNSGYILSNNKTADGKIIFTTAATKKFNIVIETESGLTFTIIASPSKSYDGASLTVYNKHVVGTNEAIESLEDNNSYTGQITHLLTSIINGKRPSGFIETKSADIQLPLSITQYLQVEGINSWNGESLKVQAFKVTNISARDIELNERYLWDRNVIAVSYYPNMAILKPQSAVTAYVVRKGVK